MQWLLFDPRNRLRLNVGGRTRANVLSTTASQTTDRPDGHIVVTGNLTAKSYSSEPARRKYALLGPCHPIRLTGDEFNSAGRATSVATAGVKLIHLGFIFQGKHQTFAVWNFVFANTFDRELWHDRISIQDQVKCGAVINS